MAQVIITRPDGTEEVVEFVTAEGADRYAEDLFTDMDTSEARETLVEVTHNG